MDNEQLGKIVVYIVLGVTVLFVALMLVFQVPTGNSPRAQSIPVVK